jgi:hypothetical protein
MKISIKVEYQDNKYSEFKILLTVLQFILFASARSFSIFKLSYELTKTNFAKKLLRNKMKAAIITIGDELLIGQTVDTNSAWIGAELSKSGFDIFALLQYMTGGMIYYMPLMKQEKRLMLC